MTDHHPRLVVVFDDDAHSEVKVTGEFDRLQVLGFDRLVAGVRQGMRRIVVDLRRTTIIDSAALGSLVRLRHALDEVGADLVVVVALPFQEKVMRIGGLFEYLNVEVRDAPG